MSYVQPNSIIQLMHINGIDNRYLDTIYFASESAQNSFMTSKVGVTLERNSYQRVNREYIKIKKPYDEVNTYNYMRFQNSPSNTGTGQARSNKWYYAFIIGVEYINEATTLIEYQIDDMQTWFVGTTCNPCLVEREHSSTDVWAENLEDEPVGSECYDGDEIYTDSHFTNYAMIITLSGMNVDIPSASGVITTQDQCGYTEGMFNGTWTCAVPIIGTDEQIKTSMKQTADYIWDTIKGDWNTEQTPIKMLNMIMFPEGYVSQTTSPSNLGVPLSPTPKEYQHIFNRPTRYDNFTPQNNKMLTYPYCFMYATTGDGSNEQLKWEYFDGGKGDEVTIKSYGCALGTGEIIYVPQLYNGQLENFDSKITVSNFPKCPFTYDAYQAWLASGGDTKLKTERNYSIVGTVVNTISNILGSAVSFSKSDAQESMSKNRTPDNTIDTQKTLALAQVGVNIISSGIDIAHTLTKVNYQFRDAKYQPRVVVGESSPSTMVAHRKLGMSVYNYHIRDDEAKRIDEFFTMFGYATNRVKTPNFTGRRYWNFVKTNGATISGNIPANAMANISQILDGGIMFWHGDYVGNYRIGYNGDVITNPIS